VLAETAIAVEAVRATAAVKEELSLLGGGWRPGGVVAPAGAHGVQPDGRLIEQPGIAAPEPVIEPAELQVLEDQGGFTAEVPFARDSDRRIVMSPRADDEFLPSSRGLVGGLCA